MKELKYIKISSIEQYNKYCTIHEELVIANYEKAIDEIELLEILIEEYDDRIQKQSYAKLTPVELLKSLLKDSPLNQTQFAKEIAISRQLLSDILNYRRNISKEVAAKLATFFAMKQEAFNRDYELKLEAAPSVEKDDLQLIHGIGQKTEQILNAANISTFKDLLEAVESQEIIKILADASPNYIRFYNKKSWEKEAKYYANIRTQKRKRQASSNRR